MHVALRERGVPALLESRVLAPPRVERLRAEAARLGRSHDVGSGGEMVEELGLGLVAPALAAGTDELGAVPAEMELGSLRSARLRILTFHASAPIRMSA